MTEDYKELQQQWVAAKAERDQMRKEENEILDMCDRLEDYARNPKADENPLDRLALLVDTLCIRLSVIEMREPHPKNPIVEWLVEGVREALEEIKGDSDDQT